MTACEALIALGVALPSMALGIAVIVASRRRLGVRTEALDRHAIARAHARGLVGFFVGS